MAVARIFVIASVALFGTIGAVAIVKKSQAKKSEANKSVQSQPIEINLESFQSGPVKAVQIEQKIAVEQPAAANDASTRAPATRLKPEIPEYDRVELLFKKNSPLPIVQTIAYKSHVSWKSGRSAWLVDYASHYKTHLHFIARSMNGRADYQPKAATDGQNFNVLASNINFYFYLVIDLSRCKLWLYAVMPDTQERVPLKTYRVGLGRLDNGKTSGALTPIGKYQLGSRIAVFQPKMMGNHRGKRVELITVFGTRWIPFEKELDGCSEPAKGYGIHGTPWQINSEGGLADTTAGLGKYESDGCIRLSAQDIEEIFSIVSTHNTIVELVPEFEMAKLPGKEKIY